MDCKKTWIYLRKPHAPLSQQAWKSHTHIYYKVYG